MHKLVPLLFLLLLPLAETWADSVTAPASISGATTLSAEEVIELILNEPALVVIDSRMDDEYLKGHIEGAISLPDTQMSERALARHVASRDTPLLFYCNGERCRRSTNAITKAQEWGYGNLYWFRGGWLEWRDKKLPVTR